MPAAPFPRERLADALRIYLVTDRALCGDRDLVSLVEAAVDGGATCVQLREKTAETRAFVEVCRALVARLRPRGVPVLVNDRLDVALAAEADGLHVGQSDLSVEDARRLLPPGALLGLSVETLAQAEAARDLPVDYLGVSPLFATPTKTNTAPPFGLAGLAQVRARSRHPLVAIGGLNAQNAAAARAAGADGIAVVSAILAAADPRAAAAQLAAAFNTEPPEHRP